MNNFRPLQFTPNNAPMPRVDDVMAPGFSPARILTGLPSLRKKNGFGLSVLMMHWMFLTAISLSTPVVYAGSVSIPGMSSATVKVASIKERQFRTTVRQRYDYSCGSAALATLLTSHYRDPIGEQAVFEAMWQTGDQEKIRREGFSLLDIKRFLEARGYSADGYDAPLDKLQQVGIPAITLIRDHGYNHFVVVKGVRDGRVAVGDPALGARIIPLEQFEKMRLNRILFVINGARDIAIFNSRTDWHVREKAPLGLASDAGNITSVTLMRRGANDF